MTVEEKALIWARRQKDNVLNIDILPRLKHMGFLDTNVSALLY